jgi:phospholipid transport system transporter-binding protein
VNSDAATNFRQQATLLMIDLQSDCIRFSGSVTVATVTRLLAEGEKMVKAGARILDFSAVTEMDSAAVALVLHLQRVAASSGVSAGALRLQGMPAAMINLAGLYGVQELLQPA